ncbi:MAG: hypothetical protein CR997_13465 [Acidobacteria bacterium]|nr:MAG: hypothetical protein CR997_13465 [Acidobacteriota bacterium]
MKKIVNSCLCLVMLFSFFSCSDQVGENLLYGYDRGKKTFKLETTLTVQRYTDATVGYRYESTNYWGVGNKSSRKTVRTAWLNKDYSVRRSEKTETINGNLVHTHIERQDDTLTIKRIMDRKVISEKKVKVKEPVFVELLTQMYVRDIQEKGESKRYPVLNDKHAMISPLEVRFLGPQTVDINGESMELNHYQIQALAAPKEYDNYYVDPDSMKILKITFGDIVFKPE